MTPESVMPNLYVTDVERSVAFYRDRLGGTETFRLPATGVAEHVELRLGDVVIAVSSIAAVLREGLPAPTAGHPMELVVWCDSTDAAVEELRPPARSSSSSRTAAMSPATGGPMSPTRTATGSPW